MGCELWQIVSGGTTLWHLADGVPTKSPTVCSGKPSHGRDSHLFETLATDSIATPRPHEILMKLCTGFMRIPSKHICSAHEFFL